MSDSQEISSPYNKNYQRLRRWHRLVSWGKKNKLGTKIEIALAILALASGVATYAALSRKAAPFEVTTGTIRISLLLNVIFLLALAGVIARRLARLWVQFKKGASGSKLQSKIVGYFSLIAVGPPILMVIFSALFLEFGIQSWFSDKVRSTLNDSLIVAEAYIEEHRRVIEADVAAMANDINREAIQIQSNSRRLLLLVRDQVAKRALSEAIVFDSNGTKLAEASLNFQLSQQGLPDWVMPRVNQGELVIISETDDDRVRAVIKLTSFFDAYLYVSRFVDANVLGHVETAKQAVADYENLEGERSDIQFRFNFVFLIVALVILMAAVWIGLWLASQISNPIAKLLDASEQIGQGNLKVRVPVLSSSDELGTLSRAFNKMISQIDEQQEDLLSASHKIDTRRRFIEAVLSGVSAGIIGLDKDCKIKLPNKSAMEFLDKSQEELTDKPVGEIIPEISHLIKDLMEHSLESVNGQVSIMKNGAIRTVLLRISTEIEEETDTAPAQKTGYVLTFDDITEELDNQRTAAWADVARRIAHEIKNPLTPIQLSAERLFRKYEKEISTDPEIFKQCTDTITRQVGDLRRMVDEFSSFARMQVPVFKKEDIVDVARQVMFMGQVGHPGITFQLQAHLDDPSLICDGRLIAQALTNIIKNASESINSRPPPQNEQDSLPQGQVEIFIEEEKDIIEISIEDNGKGLPQELSERLTEPYVTTREKGTGLGLAITRKIIEDHGGTITLLNKEKVGARVFIRFSKKTLLKLTKDYENDFKLKKEHHKMKVVNHGS